MRNTVNGRLVGIGTGIDVEDPATLELIDSVDICGEAEVDAAVDAAASAAAAWGESVSARMEALGDCVRVLEEHRDELAELLSREQGKPVAQAHQELRGSSTILKWYAQLDVQDKTIRDTATDVVVTGYRPIGVVGIIAPWNFPLTILGMKLWAALRAGNTVVIKPASTTPLTTLRVVELIGTVLPAGVVNSVTGGGDTGRLLSRHPRVDKISFTGSTGVGRSVMADAAGTGKRLTLELGGNDPAILLDDVDLDAVLPTILRSSFHNAGQVCQAIKRLYVPRAMVDDVVDRLVALGNSTYVLGRGLEDGITMGPVNNAAQKQRIVDLVADAESRGGKVHPIGTVRTDQPGYFLQPVVVSGLDDNALLVAEEQFGPALPVVAYDDVEAVIGTVNAGEFGLDASVWSADEDKAVAVASRIKAGQVFVNTHAGPPDPEIPFGGAKGSGFGRELGLVGFEEVSELRVLRIARAGDR